MNDTIFGKILRKEIPTDLIYEDDLSVAFNDINPQAPIHILIIPKKLIAMPQDIGDEDVEVVGNLFLVASKIAKDLKIDEGYRLIMNNGTNAGQSVFHIHLHMLSGRKLSWPPG
jgi:histidine triad (HIT) family protein|tara:strand:+ start:116 stop:457 length:342 start_codon:yes stop_codon:yes gene_type:complete